MANNPFYAVIFSELVMVKMPVLQLIIPYLLQLL